MKHLGNIYAVKKYCYVHGGKVHFFVILDMKKVRTSTLGVLPPRERYNFIILDLSISL